ncbi:MAG: peptidase S1, partial [Maricaulis sp.]|nr:peptidase S1 [Maricaulis sp.]
MSMKTILAATLAATAFAGLATAQDFSLAPTFGEVSLNPGFAPDPYMVTLIAGGTIDASGLGEGCAGMIANAPDFRVNYGAG